MRRWIGILLIIAGLCSGLYHFLEWQEGKSAAQNLTKKEISQYTQKKEKRLKPLPPQKEAQVLASQVNYSLGTKVAELVIPKIKQKYAVYWGADEKTLQKGVGMFVSDLTTPPNGNGHTVLSGHRDTVFVRLGELKKNDELLVEYNGVVYVYKINKIWITDKDDRTVIVKKDKSVLTLTTCYPFTFIGAAPERYIIQADLVSAN